MATKYARASGNWTTDATWSTTSGGSADTTKPTAADDVVLDAASGAINVTIDSGAVARSLDCNGYTGTLTHTAAVACTLGDGTAPAGNRALRLVSGMTYVRGSNSRFHFVSTSGTVQTVTTGGKTMHDWLVGVGSTTTVQLVAALTCLGDIDHISGIFDTNSLAVSTGHWLSSYSFGRTATFGSSAIAVTGTGTVWSAATATNLTVTANTATVTVSAATATIALGTKDWNGLSFVLPGTAGTSTVTGNATIANLTKVATVACTLALPTSSGITVTNAFNVNGILGQLLTLTGDVTKASGNVICSYLNISSSDAAGGATFYAGRTSTNGGGNTGWLFVDYVTGTATGSGTGDGTAVGTRTVLGVATGDGTGDGSAIGLRTVIGVAEGSGSGDGTATGLRLVYGTAEGAGEGSGLAIGGQVDPEGGLCGYWLHSDDLRPNGCTPCKSVTAESPSDDILNEAILAASEYLNAAVQFQFPGICENTVRPCGGEEGFGFGAGLFAWSQIPFYFPPGVFPLWWAGCGCAGACNCCGPPAFSLGKIPIVAVSEVKLDGEILEPEVDYTVVGDLLARLDPDGSGNDTWPACQNIALPDTEEGTFSVTFTWGAMPPSLGLAAARDLACLLVADACGEDCKPSERMVTRQAGGTTVQLISPDGDIRTSMPRTVKLFIDAFGPPKPSMKTFPKIRRPNSGQGLIVGPVDYGIGWQRGGWGAGCAGCG